jgi:pyruvate dehydrogenase E1 component alpha subunit
MADPPGTAIFDSVFAEQTPELAQQREEFVAYHAGFEGGDH